MASDALSPHVVSETANPIILRNRLAFEETKKAMQNDVPFPFVNALDRMCQFIEKDDAYYPEALPEYIDILEVNYKYASPPLYQLCHILMRSLVRIDRRRST